MRRSMITGTVGACILAATLAAVGAADVVTISGNLSYDGPYSGDTVYVAVLDSTVENILALDALPTGSTTFDLAYSLDFDNSAVSVPVLVAGVLDVDGSGFDIDLFPEDVLSPGDVLGWYASQPIPTMLDAGVSHSGTDFSLPTGEVRGTVIFAPGMTDVEIEAIPDAMCSEGSDWSPPIVTLDAGGAYTVVGLYPGTWCVAAVGFGIGSVRICYDQDLTCSSPSTFMLTEGGVKSGVDFDFSVTPAESATWGRVKSLYR